MTFMKMDLKTLVVYHSEDYDGICSREIVKKIYPNAEYLGFTYGDTIPTNLNSFDQLILVDITFPPDIMLSIKDRLTWVDHHITAIQDSEKNGYSGVPGIRKVGEGACSLAWKYFMKSPVPKAVSLLSAYDVWDKGKYDWERETLPFQYALRGLYGLNLPVFFEENLEDKLNIGRIILKYQKEEWRRSVNKNAFPITVDGKWKGIAMITTNSGSLQFDHVYNDYDIFVWGTLDKNGVFKFSIASNKTRAEEFNCGVFMKEHYHGGGHQGVAGGWMYMTQFQEFIQQKIL